MKLRPLSSDQERMWVIAQLTLGALEDPAIVRIRGAFSPVAFHDAVSQLIARHEGLRTSFPVDDGVPHQLVADDAIGVVRLVDLTAALHDTSAVLDRLVAAEASRAFDLATGPLLRVTLIRLAPGDHLLIIAVHHLAADLWSMAILWSELSTAYDGAAAGVPNRLPPIALQPADLADRARQRLTPKRLALLRAVWRARLDGARAVDLPVDHARPTLPNLGSQSCQASLDQRSSVALRRLAASGAVTLFVTLLAGMQALIVRWARQDDLVVASVNAGRRGRAAERVIGMLTQRLIVRLTATGNPTVHELLRRTHDAVLDSLDTIDLPYVEIVNLVDPLRDREPSPLRQVGLSLHNVPTRPLGLVGLEILGRPVPASAAHRGVSEADLWLEAFDDGHGPLRLRLQVDDVIFEAQTMRRTIERLTTVLSSMAHRPDARLSELDVIGPTERAQLDELGCRWAEDDAIVAVVDERLAPVPIGTVGELCLLAKDGGLRRTERMVRFRWDGQLEPASLPATPVAGRAVPANQQAPSAATATVVADQVSALLGRTAVQGRDNFFHLGGTSMDAARLMVRIERHFGAAPSLYAIMTAGTIDGIASAVDRARATR